MNKYLVYLCCLGSYLELEKAMGDHHKRHADGQLLFLWQVTEVHDFWLLWPAGSWSCKLAAGATTEQLWDTGCHHRHSVVASTCTWPTRRSGSATVPIRPLATATCFGVAFQRSFDHGMSWLVNHCWVQWFPTPPHPSSHLGPHLPLYQCTLMQREVWPQWDDIYGLLLADHGSNKLQAELLLQTLDSLTFFGSWHGTCFCFIYMESQQPHGFWCIWTARRLLQNKDHKGYEILYAGQSELLYVHKKNMKVNITSGDHVFSTWLEQPWGFWLHFNTCPGHYLDIHYSGYLDFWLFIANQKNGSLEQTRVRYAD